MPRDNQIDLIEQREREIAKEIARLQEEAGELAVTLKVLRRFAAPAASEEAAMDDSEEPTEGEASMGPTRPSGCPTNYQMVDMILASAEKEGKDGLTISELVAEMRKRYWPGLVSAQVAAPIYKMARKGRFRKTASGKFKRVRKSPEEIQASSEESSLDEGIGHYPVNG